MQFGPLLPPGINDLSLRDAKGVFVDSFLEQKRRTLLWEGVLRFLALLGEFDIELEIWIDGSFVTGKPEPNDIDVLVLGAQTDVDQLGGKRREQFASIFRDKRGIRDIFLCDVYFAVAENERNRSYWRGWFCFDRDETPKGLCRLRIPKDLE